MRLLHATVTGADEDTNIDEMIKVAKEYPCLEFGILVSTDRAGTQRYPSIEWIIEAGYKFENVFHHPRFSYHICGSISREFIVGKVNLINVPPIKFIHRIQINVNAALTEWLPIETASLIRDIRVAFGHIDFIFQYNQSNYRMWYDLAKCGILPHILYDESCGRGKKIGTYNRPISGLVTGYSGGLNPDNIKDALEEIDQVVGNGITWVDAETGIRTEDNKLDLNKVVSFADICAPFYMSRIAGA